MAEPSEPRSSSTLDYQSRDAAPRRTRQSRAVLFNVCVAMALLFAPLAVARGMFGENPDSNGFGGLFLLFFCWPASLIFGLGALVRFALSIGEEGVLHTLAKVGVPAMIVVYGWALIRFVF